MANADGSMTFDWIFFAIVAIPWVYGLWELRKSYTNAAKSNALPDRRGPASRF